MRSVPCRPGQRSRAGSTFGTARRVPRAPAYACFTDRDLVPRQSSDEEPRRVEEPRSHADQASTMVARHARVSSRIVAATRPSNRRPRRRRWLANGAHVHATASGAVGRRSDRHGNQCGVRARRRPASNQRVTLAARPGNALATRALAVPHRTRNDPRCLAHRCDGPVITPGSPMVRRRRSVRTRIAARRYAVRDQIGKFLDIRACQRTRAADLRHESKAERTSVQDPIERNVSGARTMPSGPSRTRSGPQSPPLESQQGERRSSLQASNLRDRRVREAGAAKLAGKSFAKNVGRTALTKKPAQKAAKTRWHRPRRVARNAAWSPLGSLQGARTQSPQAPIT